MNRRTDACSTKRVSFLELSINLKAGLQNLVKDLATAFIRNLHVKYPNCETLSHNIGG
jgi:hypothetical protein